MVGKIFCGLSGDPCVLFRLSLSIPASLRCMAFFQSSLVPLGLRAPGAGPCAAVASLFLPLDKRTPGPGFFLTMDENPVVPGLFPAIDSSLWAYLWQLEGPKIAHLQVEECK